MGLRSVGVFSHWFLIAGLLCRWSFWAARVYYLPTTRILRTAEPLLIVAIERILCVSHSRLCILFEVSILLNHRSRIGCKLLSTVTRWSICCGSFMQCDWSESLPSTRRGVRYHWPPTAVCIVSRSNLWVFRIHAEITSIRVSSIVTLTFTTLSFS